MHTLPEHSPGQPARGSVISRREDYSRASSPWPAPSIFSLKNGPEDAFFYCIGIKKNDTFSVTEAVGTAQVKKPE